MRRCKGSFIVAPVSIPKSKKSACQRLAPDKSSSKLVPSASVALTFMSGKATS